MNYRHAYHAGNFADVLKHLVLVLCIQHLKKKDAAFRVVDTHAGIGRYRLDAAESGKSPEWQDGIAKVMAAAPHAPAKVRAVLQPYLDLIAAENRGMDGFKIYPGSPALAAQMLRRSDTLIANELHPQDFKALTKAMAGDRQAKLMELDGWLALKSLLPPPERRGVILVDPPFEEPGELIRLTEGLKQGLERFKSGTFLLWYPIKDPKIVQRFRRAITEVGTAAGIETILDIELLLRAPRNPDLLNGCGLVVANPPFTLERDMATVLPDLAAWLGIGPGADGTVTYLKGAAAQ